MAKNKDKPLSEVVEVNWAKLVGIILGLGLGSVLALILVRSIN